jgi:hypothetical protein
VEPRTAAEIEILHTAETNKAAAQTHLPPRRRPRRAAAALRVHFPVRWWVTRASRCRTAANRPACNWPPSSLRPPARPRAVCCTVAEAGSASGEEKILSGQQHFSVWAWVERASSGSKPKPSHATHAHTLLVASFFSQELPTS